MIVALFKRNPTLRLREASEEGTTRWYKHHKTQVSCLELLTEGLNAQRMLQIYEHDGFLRSAEMFGANNKDWILQENNDPKHRSHLCTSWEAENSITTLDWPSQSPDAKPIENVWSVVKRKLAGRRAFILKQLSRRIKEVWRSQPTKLGICTFFFCDEKNEIWGSLLHTKFFSEFFSQ